MSYAGAAKTPIHSTSVCTQTDVSWVGTQPVTRKQRPAASVTSRPVPSVSRSVGTPTRGADVQKPAAPTRSSPPKKDKTSNKPSSPKVSPVHESDVYFTVKTYKGKSKDSYPMTAVKISPIKLKESILNKERLTPSRADLVKTKVKKVGKNVMFSDIHKQRPSADDFFGDIPQCSNQTDVSLTSASDLGTNVKSKGKIKKSIIRLPVD